MGVVKASTAASLCSIIGFSPLAPNAAVSRGKNSCLVFVTGFYHHFSPRKLSLSADRRKSVTAQARKKKTDSHNFAPKPDEATGPFPEAVLLKERKVHEDGSVLPEFADAEEEQLFEFLNLQLESDLNVDEMRHYEVVYLIHENCLEEVPSVISKVEDFIKEKKGKIWRINNWGLRRLAYKIRKAKNANYVLMNFEIGAKWINDFKTMLDKDERVIRHLVMKQDKAITEDCPPPPEFHTLRASMVDDDEDGYDDEDDWEEGDEEDDVAADSHGENNVNDGVIIVGEDDYACGDDGLTKKLGRTLNTQEIAR